MKPSTLLCLTIVGCVKLAAADTAPVPAGQVLFGQLRQCEEAEGLSERIRATRTGMEALLAADRDTLLVALDGVLADGRLYQDVRILLVEQCVRKHPQATLAKLEGASGMSHYIELAAAAWGVIARSDPERAAEWVRQLYQPGGNFNRATLQSAFHFHRLAGSIMQEVGAAWFRRDGVAAMKQLGALPHAGDLDGPLFRGMCEAATHATQRLALLDWMTSPPGNRLDRFEKGGVTWYETMLSQAAREDLGTTRAWLERRFPPGQSRQSDLNADWDITQFRIALFHAWAETDARHAADWLAGQIPPGDRDEAYFLSVCFQALSSAPNCGLDVALEWLVQQRNKPAFVAEANVVLQLAASAIPNSKARESVTARFSKLPLALREQILLHKKEGDPFDSVVFSPLPANQQVLRGLFPLEAERKSIEAKVRKLAPAKPDADQANESEPGAARGWHGAFKLEERKPAAGSTATELALAERLAAQHKELQTSRDPQARLAGLASLEWLEQAKTEDFTRIIPAHLENTKGAMDGFAAELVNAWADHDWRAGEKFAWDADLSDSLRESILIAIFEQAAMASPDEVFARLKSLIADARLHSESLNGGRNPQTGPGYFWFAFDIPKRLGAGWIVRDGPHGVDKMKALPAAWVNAAIEGAAGRFRSGEAGLSLLDRIVRMDAEDSTPKQEEYHCTGLHWDHWLQASPVISRLASINLDALVHWLEASPARLEKGQESFDGFYDACRELFHRNPLEAAKWAHSVRPDQDVTWWLISALAQKDEAQALAWIDAHPDDPHLDSGLTVLVRCWEITRPAEAAKLIVRMSTAARVTEAAQLIHTWKRLDAAAAQRFLDDTFAGSPKDRKTAEVELARLEKNARDRREP